MEVIDRLIGLKELIAFELIFECRALHDITLGDIDLPKAGHGGLDGFLCCIAVVQVEIDGARVFRIL